ncbi:MAG: DUF1963 domain-containing protein [Vulcanimicrobiota bacterium]
MSAFLQKAFSAWDCVYICGAENFWDRLQAVLNFQDAGEYTVTIADEWPLPARSGPCIAAAEGALRAALRQDADCILLPRAEEHGPLLLQAALTGHRVVAGFAGTPRQVLDLLTGEQPELAATQERTLFFDPSGLWMFRTEKKDFERVADFAEGAFSDLCLPGESTAAPTPPPAQAPEVPAEWGPPSPLLPELEAILAPLARPCYAPLFELGEPIGQLGGSPMLAHGEEWPRCGACQQRMHLICQLDLSHLPTSQPLPNQGWLQLFYCTANGCNPARPWGPFSCNALARRLEQGVLSSEDPPSPQYPVRAITGWLALTDYPGWEERPPLTDRQQAASNNLDEPAFLEHFCLTDDGQREKAQAFLRNYSGDKLLGWPAWSQGPEYPQCPLCQSPMQMYWQVNNDGRPDGPPGFSSCHGQIFAGDGNGHLFLCSSHPEQMTFSWACG